MSEEITINAVLAFPKETARRNHNAVIIVSHTTIQLDAFWQFALPPVTKFCNLLR